MTYKQDDEPLPVKPFTGGSCLRQPLSKEEMERIAKEIAEEFLRSHKPSENKK